MEIENPTINGDVLAYDKEQTKEINRLTDIINSINDFVIERGANSNGEWIKYESGLLIQMGTHSFGTQTLATLAAPIYWKASISMGNFPIPFVGKIPYFNYSLNRNQNACWGTDDITKLSLTSLPGMDLMGVGSTVQGASATWIAIGRHKD